MENNVEEQAPPSNGEGADDQGGSDPGAQVNGDGNGKALKLVNPGAHNEHRILTLYCGGTIGMKSHNGVYCPEPNYLMTELKTLPMFHDPSYVIEPDRNGFQTLAMPLSKKGKRVIYSIVEYDPLLDSSNMTFEDYTRLANDVGTYYNMYDSFVILHGTDTMAYTASALSFMLENLGKMVVVTGSQIPIFETRSDGRDNFLGALIMAGHYHIPEVSLYFHNRLMRGNRSVKMDAEGFDAFHTPNMAPIATLEINIRVNWDAVFRHHGLKRFRVQSNFCPFVGVLRLFPSITASMVSQFLQPPLRGAVLQTYGAGNGPAARKDLLDILQEASKRGVLILNITQCSRGTVSPLYAAGKELLDVGIIPGCDMTVEAALMKMSYILSHEDWTVEEKRKMLGVNMRGELSVGSSDEKSLLEFSLIEKMSEAMRLSSKEEIETLRSAVFPTLLCAAAREGNIDGLQKLKAADALLSMSDYDGRTPLHIACSEGHLDTVNYLLEYGSPVHIRDRYGSSPLDDACRFNHHEVIKVLREAGAHVAMPAARIGMNLCNTAAIGELKDMESWDLAGVDLNQADYDGRTALHLATVHRNLEMVTFLLSRGARPDLKDNFKRSAADEAKRRNYTQISALLENALKPGV